MLSWAQITGEPCSPATENSGTAANWPRFAQEARRMFFARHVRLRRLRLAQEHRDLDDLVSVLGNDPTTDVALVARLKKRKLRLRDEIACLDAQLACRLVRAPP